MEIKSEIASENVMGIDLHKNLSPEEWAGLVRLTNSQASTETTPANYAIYRRLCELGLIKLSIANGHLQLTPLAIEILTFRDTQDTG